MQHVTEVIASISGFSSSDKPLFHFFQPSSFTGSTGYVDGGNGCIIQTPWYCVHFIRCAFCLLEEQSFSSFKRWEFFVVAKKNDGNSHITLFGAPAFFQMPSLIKSSCSDAGNIVREHFEQSIVLWGGKFPLKFLVKDGLMGEMNEKIPEIMVPVIGLAKTTEQADIALIQQPGIWWTEHNGTFCRLHPFATSIFRYETENNSILEELAFLSRDLVFPGYPYGLILADKLARVSNEEKDYLLCLFESIAGKSWRNICAGMRLLNSHDILDSIT